MIKIIIIPPDYSYERTYQRLCCMNKLDVI